MRYVRKKYLLLVMQEEKKYLSWSKSSPTSHGDNKVIFNQNLKVRYDHIGHIGL